MAKAGGRIDAKAKLPRSATRYYYLLAAHEVKLKPLTIIVPHETCSNAKRVATKLQKSIRHVCAQLCWIGWLRQLNTPCTWLQFIWASTSYLAIACNLYRLRITSREDLERALIGQFTGIQTKVGRIQELA